ncbi:MAG: hypothetical protein K6G85_00005 [Eubacterium sp.]|nr:hypothetical protein [Eubacterium sp.]
MRMKKVLATVLSIAMVAGLVTVSNVSVKAESTTTIEGKVNTVDNITSTGFGEVTSFDWQDGAAHEDDVFKVKFTLKQPAYVKFTVVSTVCEGSWERLGNVYSPNVEAMSGVVVKKLELSTDKNLTSEKVVVLEAGTYNLAFRGKKGNESKGTVTTQIDAQYVPRTGNVTATTAEKAVSLKAGEYKSGLITDSYKDQYFELKLTKKSTVSFDVNISAPSMMNKPQVSYKLYTLSGSDLTTSLQKQQNLNWGAIKEYLFGGGDYNPTGNTGKVTLNAGTYYLKISQKENECAVKVKANVTTQKTVPTLATPKLKKFKKNTKKITGTATKGATVKVVVGKKPYTTKANGKGKFTVKLKSKLKKNVRIKVSAKLKGYKNSKTVTYRVK